MQGAAVLSSSPLVGSPRSGETGEGFSPRMHLLRLNSLEQPLIRRFAVQRMDW